MSIFIYVQIKKKGFKKIDKKHHFIIVLIIFFLIVLGLFLQSYISRTYDENVILKKSNNQVYLDCNNSLIDNCDYFREGETKYTYSDIYNISYFNDSSSLSNWIKSSEEHVSIKEDLIFLNVSGTEPTVGAICKYNHWVCYYGSCRFIEDSRVILCNRFGVI